ncbi:MAG: porin [Bacteroidales bacterium]
MLSILILLTHNITAAGFADSGPENNPDSTSNIQNILKKMDDLTDIYGTLRFKAGVGFNGESGIQDNTSRLGIRGAVPITKGIDAVMQLEVGVGLVGNKTTIKFSGDPGGTVGEVDNVFTSRLGYLGIRTKYGQFTWGKQWSVYSDVGGWTDSFNAFGGEASGTYSANTDGSVSGTGRASNSFQYRLKLKYLEAGVQVQNRTITDSSTTWADTYAAALILKTGFGLRIGAAYDKVRDGILHPELSQPKYGDESWVLGLYYDSRDWMATFTASNFKNHEKDNHGNYFSGYGLEFYTIYRFRERWGFYGGFNYLKPYDDSPAGNYRIMYLDLGASYGFARTSKVFIETRLDDSRNNDDSSLRAGVVAFGIFFEFGY